MHTRTFCNYMHEKGISHLHNKIYNKVFSVKNNGLGDQRKILNCHLDVYYSIHLSPNHVMKFFKRIFFCYKCLDLYHTLSFFPMFITCFTRSLKRNSAQRCILQFLFQWIYYCYSSNSTRKETGKTHLCAVS